MQKYVWTRILPGFYKAPVDLQIVKVKVNPLPGPTSFLWHMDAGIKMQKYVLIQILPGLYKAVVETSIVKVKVNLLLGPTWLLFCMWIEELKCKNMFGPGSYLVYIRQLSTYKL